MSDLMQHMKDAHGWKGPKNQSLVKKTSSEEPKLEKEKLTNALKENEKLTKALKIIKDSADQTKKKPTKTAKAINLQKKSANTLISSHLGVKKSNLQKKLPKMKR